MKITEEDILEEIKIKQNARNNSCTIWANINFPILKTDKQALKSHAAHIKMPVSSVIHILVSKYLRNKEQTTEHKGE